MSAWLFIDLFSEAQELVLGQIQSTTTATNRELSSNPADISGKNGRNFAEKTAGKTQYTSFLLLESAM